MRHRDDRVVTSCWSTFGNGREARWHHRSAVKKTGASCDWSRMPSRWIGLHPLRAAVFVDLYEGLICRQTNGELVSKSLTASR